MKKVTFRATEIGFPWVDNLKKRQVPHGQSGVLRYGKLPLCTAMHNRAFRLSVGQITTVAARTFSVWGAKKKENRMREIDWSKPLRNQEDADGPAEASGAYTTNDVKSGVAPEKPKTVDESGTDRVTDSNPRSNRVEQDPDNGPCVCCGSIDVDPYVLQGFAHPICNDCLEVEEGTPEAQLV